MLSMQSKRLISKALIFSFALLNSCIWCWGDPLLAVSDFLVQNTTEQMPRSYDDLLKGRKLVFPDRPPFVRRDLGPSASRLNGVQESTSYLMFRRHSVDVIAQTFDFGDQGRSFGRFDAGDGGQIVTSTSDITNIIETEDGKGAKFFVPKSCSSRGTHGWINDSGWLVARRSVKTEEHEVSLLKLSNDPLNCPSTFDASFTRWFYKVVVFESYFSGERRDHSLETLVSEHFGGPTISMSSHLERFYFTKELGWTRWERWQNPGAAVIPSMATSPENTDEARSQRLESNGRCLGVNYNAHPAGWKLVDCRQWTNIVPSTISSDVYIWHSRALKYVDQLRWPN